MTDKNTVQLAINTIRTLSIDVVQQAKSAIQAHEKLLTEGIRSRLVSMPSWDIFEHQSREYQDSVQPPEVEARVAVEQASTFGWERYVGVKGRVIGMHTFGASAPLKELQNR